MLSQAERTFPSQPREKLILFQWLLFGGKKGYQSLPEYQKGSVHTVMRNDRDYLIIRDDVGEQRFGLATNGGLLAFNSTQFTDTDGKVLARFRGEKEWDFWGPILFSYRTECPILSALTVFIVEPIVLSTLQPHIGNALVPLVIAYYDPVVRAPKTK